MIIPSFDLNAGLADTLTKAAIQTPQLPCAIRSDKGMKLNAHTNCFPHNIAKGCFDRGF